MEVKENKIQFQMPENACNAHLHIIDPKFPNNGEAERQSGTVERYKIVAEQSRLPRAVFVQAKPFALDNSCLIDAIAKFGSDCARGIAVINSTTAVEEIAQLHDAGVRGVRFSVWNPKNAVVSMEDCRPLAEKIAQFGWNVQLHMGAAQLMDYAQLIRELPCRTVVDHMGRLDPALGTKDPAFKMICEMIDRGSTWVKLSGPYLNTKIGYPWTDCIETARAYAEYAPERILWGSDFPYITEKVKPDPIELVNLIPVWMETSYARRRALVDNPEEVYGF